MCVLPLWLLWRVTVHHHNSGYIHLISASTFYKSPHFLVHIESLQSQLFYSLYFTKIHAVDVKLFWWKAGLFMSFSAVSYLSMQFWCIYNTLCKMWSIHLNGITEVYTKVKCSLDLVVYWIFHRFVFICFSWTCAVAAVQNRESITAYLGNTLQPSFKWKQICKIFKYKPIFTKLCGCMHIH